MAIAHTLRLLIFFYFEGGIPPFQLHYIIQCLHHYCSKYKNRINEKIENYFIEHVKTENDCNKTIKQLNNKLSNYNDRIKKIIKSYVEQDISDDKYYSLLTPLENARSKVLKKKNEQKKLVNMTSILVQLLMMIKLFI